jgi:3-isopropylmalate/(R)-2-methylmalate dehydratase small subunit
MRLPFVALDALVVPLDRTNVDTDAIIPKQFMKSIRRTGFGDNLFDEWRYLDHGEPGDDCSLRTPNPSFVLNQARYLGAQVLLARENFGCGSSREHAAWALRDFGIRALIAPSFAEIFHSNCLQNGLLPVMLAPSQIQKLFSEASTTAGYRLAIDLPAQSVTLPDGEKWGFHIDRAQKQRMVEGLDNIALTLQGAAAIRAHEQQRRHLEPWLFAAPAP